MKTLVQIMAILLFAGAAVPARAQMAVPPPMPAYQPLVDAQLDQLLGPIALYPDPLIAQILPASTVPTEIVLADRYLRGGGDPNRIDEQPWDSSVQALARYPDVLKWMDDNLDWTATLGQACLNQEQDVMNSIQRLRAAAYRLGNLRSSTQQQVVSEGGYIEILPAEPQVIYVPVYEPTVVYYRIGYGAPFIRFGVGWRMGAWLNFDFDWARHHLIVWSRAHPRPANWWHERPAQRAVLIAAHTAVWHPAERPARPGANWGDRGWGKAALSPVANRPELRPVPSRKALPSSLPRPVNSPVANRSPQPPVQPFAPGRAAPKGTFIGIESAHEARIYSARGHQSLQTVGHSAPVSRPAASPGRGGHGGSREADQRKH